VPYMSFPDRSWDMFDAYLFDIDGTLLNCTDATHYFAFCHALKLLSHRELTLDGIVVHGNVDTGILRDALTLAGIPESEWRPRLAEAQIVMGEFVHRQQSELCLDITPDARRVLEHLRSRGAKLGVATGNLERIGQLKLERAGLWKYFDFGGWSDTHEYRTDVLRAALAKARTLCGETGSVCVVGDTPYDVVSAHQNDLSVIAVATGNYSYEQLSLAKPERLLRSFVELFDPAEVPA
jgi:phosphoglycolate phosphatase